MAVAIADFRSDMVRIVVIPLLGERLPLPGTSDKALNFLGLGDRNSGMLVSQSILRG